jgi:predicted DNA-binding transcriptional regulator YafY
MDNSIEVLKSRTQHRINNNDHIQTILNAIAHKKVLCMEYKAGYTQEQTKRDVEPVGIFYLDSYWHMIAYCRMRIDYRDFRCDRISSLIETDQTFSGKHPTLKAYIAQTAEEKKLETIVIKVETNMARYLNEQKYYHGFVSERELKDNTEMTFLTMSVEGFARWFMMFGDRAEIVNPQHLKDKVGKLAGEIARRNPSI